MFICFLFCFCLVFWFGFIQSEGGKASPVHTSRVSGKLRLANQLRAPGLQQGHHSLWNGTASVQSVNHIKATKRGICLTHRGT